MNTRDWQSLPKAELHVHLLGAIPPDVVDELLRRHPPSELRSRWSSDEVASLVARAPHLAALFDGRMGGAQLARGRDFTEFLISFGVAMHLVQTRDDLVLLARRVVETLEAQGIVYAEILCSLPSYRRRGFSLDDVSAAFDAAETVDGIRVRWLVDLVRDYGPEAALATVDEVVAWRDPRVVGIHLGGYEPRYPPELFVRPFRRARDRGLRCAAHAGEAAGAGFVERMDRPVCQRRKRRSGRLGLV